MVSWMACEYSSPQSPWKGQLQPGRRQRSTGQNEGANNDTRLRLHGAENLQAAYAKRGEAVTADKTPVSSGIGSQIPRRNTRAANMGIRGQRGAHQPRTHDLRRHPPQSAVVACVYMVGT